MPVIPALGGGGDRKEQEREVGFKSACWILHLEVQLAADINSSPRSSPVLQNILGYTLNMLFYGI